MADNLKAAIGELLVELVSLGQSVSNIGDDGVQKAADTQRDFFLLAQKRARDLRGAITIAQKRLDNTRHTDWAMELGTQIVKDVKSLAPGMPEEKANTVNAVATAIQTAFEQQIKPELAKLPAPQEQAAPAAPATPESPAAPAAPEG